MRLGPCYRGALWLWCEWEPNPLCLLEAAGALRPQWSQVRNKLHLEATSLYRGDRDPPWQVRDPLNGWLHPPPSRPIRDHRSDNLLGSSTGGKWLVGPSWALWLQWWCRSWMPPLIACAGWGRWCLGNPELTLSEWSSTAPAEHHGPAWDATGHTH